IQEDLTFGVQNLPLRNQTQAGRMSKGTAQALLAKVSMYRKDWATASTQAQEVIQSGQYRLLDDYSQIWRQAGDNSSEAIFEIQTGQFNNSDFGINAYSMCQGPRVGGRGGWTDLGWGFGTPSQSLADAYELGDIRKSSTIITIDNSGKFKGTILFDGFRIPSADSVENLRYNYKAYHSENRNVESYLGNRDRKQKNVHLLRLGELYLIRAEAALELNQFGEAENTLNIVRKRAGLAPVSGLGKEQLREAIWKERRVELAMEHDRFFDLVRQGRAASVLQAQGKNFVAGKHERLPVPAVQIALSGGTLTQNPGY
ncbi:MAG: RagB/SusD family nutrient uptake outer membrane protein, partial [Spirosomataceae bacterium]